ncbi:MAG: FtsW/RodA/SpoVE family cell cycle protein [Bacteroidales bacterium]|nr:FtsW/RodA/SpoVE family cell cycle protein [Bacteroidales bacterium]
MNKILSKLHGDRTIWMMVILLCLISILAVYSSSATLVYKSGSDNTEFFILKHIVTLITGLGLMYGAHLVPYKYFSRISQIALIIAVPLLILTLIIGSSDRWLIIPGINQSFQTSDLAKLALIMYLARTLSRKQETIKDFYQGFLPVFLPIVLVCGLIVWGNFSTAALVFIIGFMMMFIGGIHWKYLGLLVGIGFVSVMLFALVVYNYPEVGRFGTWKNRIENFIHGDEQSNYQSSQAKMAIASGGLFGKLPGSSVMRNFLPQAHNDFIYAIIIEEYGLILGGILPLLFYLILLKRGVTLYVKSPNHFGAYLVIGITLSLVLQAFINMSVAVGLIPVTGQAMPLVSMGGTSIWFTCIAIGIMLSVSRQVEIESENIESNDELELQQA